MKPFQLKDKRTGALRHGGQWLIRFRAPDGDWRRMVAGATEKDAARTLAAVETDIARGTWKDPRAERAEARTRECDYQTFGDIVDSYRKFYVSRAPSSQTNLGSVVSWLSVGIKGAPPSLPLSTPIAELTPARLRKVHDAITVSPLAVATRNLLLTFTKMILRWAWKHPAIPLEQNPAADLPRFKVAGTRGGDGFTNMVSKSEVWTRAEALAMLEHAEAEGPEVFAVMLRTAFETGMRFGELCGLLWSGVDFDRRLILVSRNYDRRGTKSGKDRVVPLTAGLAARLRRWKAASPKSQEHDPVFPDGHGRVRPKYDGWAKYVRGVSTGAGTQRPGMRRFGHLTRHYYATQWLLNGGSAEQLARVLGHADTVLICKVYSHFQDADFVATVDRIGLSLEAPAEVAAVVQIHG
jgi:integrase